MKFHITITITDNETGESVLDLNTDAILASVDEGGEDGGTHCISVSKCDDVTRTATIAGLICVTKKVKKKHPNLYKLAKKAVKHTK